MKMTEGIMGMSVAVEILDADVHGTDIDAVLDYFHKVDEMFSTYKRSSEITKLNNKTLKIEDASPDVKKVLNLCDETRLATHGYFDIKIEGRIDPSGLVKGYAIYEASKMLTKKGYKNFYVEIGGDIDVRGFKNGSKWRVGIKNPVLKDSPVKVLQLSNCGIATSGTYVRGNHIYDPIRKRNPNELASVSIVAPNVYEADRFATAIFAMGERRGLDFLEKNEALEGFLITREGKEIYTRGFDKFLGA